MFNVCMELLKYELVLSITFQVQNFRESPQKSTEWQSGVCALSQIHPDTRWIKLIGVLDCYQVTVRIGTPVTGYGQESRNRAARQRIPNRVWTDEDGVEHVEVISFLWHFHRHVHTCKDMRLFASFELCILLLIILVDYYAAALEVIVRNVCYFFRWIFIYGAHMEQGRCMLRCSRTGLTGSSLIL